MKTSVGKFSAWTVTNFSRCFKAAGKIATNSALLFVLVVYFSTTANGQTRAGTQWQSLPGFARDIGAGADGSVWSIGTNPVGNGRDFGIYRWTGASWQSVDGGGVRIDVDRRGNPWIINSAGEIFRRTNNRWEKLPGYARDIGVGADGTVWVIGVKSVGKGDFDIYRWSGNFWESIDGSGIRIDVDRRGNPWIVNSAGEIFRRSNNRWEKLPGSARDIGIGADGSAWVIGTNSVGKGNFGVFRWTGDNWQNIDGGGEQITVDRFGMPWMTNSINFIFKRN